MSGNKLYIGNLDYSVTSAELSDFIGESFKVNECNVIDGKGFAFITLENSEAAQGAKETFNDQEFKGRRLKIDFATDNRSNNRPRKGSFGGGGGGGGGKRRY